MKTTTSDIKIKSIKGEFIIVTPGLQVCTMLESKKNVTLALELSNAHKWLVTRATGLGKNKITAINQLPSVDHSNPTANFFYLSVKLVVEQLSVLEGLSIVEACNSGNALLTGFPPITDDMRITESIKDALRYGRALGKF